MKINFEKGGALLVTIVIIMSMVLASAVAMVSWSRKGYKYAVRKTENSRAFYVADSAIKYALNRIIFDSSKSVLNLNQISNDFMTIASSFIPGNEFQITKFTIAETMTNGIFTRNIEDIFLLEKMYDIRCQVTNLANNGLEGNYAEISCFLGDLSVSIFQFGMYYQDIELELAPGSTETRIGRVHSNKSMYLAPYGTLKFLDKVTCADEIYHGGFGGDVYRHKGTGSIYFKDKDGNYVNMKTNSSKYSFLDSRDPEWKLKATERWGDTVKTKEHGVGTIQLPFTDSLENTRVLIDHDPMTNEPYEITKQRFENKAGLVITPEGDIYEQTGELTNAEFTARTYIDNITNVNWAIATNQFYNRRNMDYWTNDTANGMVYPIDINIGLFNGWVSNQPSLSFKDPNSDRAGIIYIEQTNKTGHAIRISNAEELYPLPYGFTLATPNSLYVKGDYNTKIGSSYTTNHPSALLSDAMTILSDYWRDEDNQVWPANIINPYRYPNPHSYCNYACSTKINTAVMTGSAETSTDVDEYRFSGAANNLIRYLEYWKYRTFEINGNQTCLWKSKFEWQPYIYQSKYDSSLDPWHYYWPSYRRFLYDSNLKSRSPPGFDSFYTYRVLAWKKIH